MKEGLDKTKNRDTENKECNDNPTHSIRVSPGIWIEINDFKGKGKSWDRFFKDIMYGHDTS